MSPGGRGHGREHGVREDWQWVGCVRRPTVSGLSPPGFASPCSFVAAVSGANGSILWERPAAQDGGLVLCDVAQPRDSGAAPACILVGRAGSFIAVNSSTGRPVPSAPSLGPPVGADGSVLSGSAAGWEGRVGSGKDTATLQSHTKASRTCHTPLCLVTWLNLA